MIEIKFRGQHHITKKWLYGWLIRLEGNNYIINQDTDKDIFESMNDKGSNQVIFETVGQFTGLKDKNNKEIYEGDGYEGDGYEVENDDETYVGIIIFDEGSFCLKITSRKKKKKYTKSYYQYDITGTPELNNFEKGKVIGNIYENQELSKKQ